MSGLPVTLDLPDKVLEQIAALVAERFTERLEADPWLDVDQAADYLRCKRQRIYDLSSQGRLAAGRDGSRLLFRRSVLDVYLERGAA